MSLHHSRKSSLARACATGAALLGCLLALPAATSHAAVIADSLTQWTTTGAQGVNNWFNGYWNRTTDANGIYSPGDLTLFTQAEWTGSAYNLLPPADPPWTEMAAESLHPNDNAPANEHWPIRRWVANTTAPLALNWSMRKGNTGGGNGVQGILYINGVQQDAASIGGTDGVGVNRTWYANVNAGDVIDLALDPLNNDDGADGSLNRLRVDNFIPANPTQPPVLAGNAAADWSPTGTQGANGWFYGYYDVRFDAANDNDGYQPGDFQTFLRDGTNTLSPTNHWNGSMYDLAASVAPWTELSSGGGHPAANGQGDPTIHWAVRRWVSDVSGPTNITGQFFQNGSANGDGVVGRIFLNGVEVFEGLSDFSPANFNLTLNLAPNDVLDFAADPNGAGVLDLNLINDGSDGFLFSASILGPGAPFVPIPEPSSVVMAALGGIGLFALALRKRKR